MSRPVRLLRSLAAGLVVLQVFAWGASQAGAEEPNPTPQILRSLKDLENARIGLTLGSVFEGYLQKNLPNAKLMQFKSGADSVLALKSGRIDALGTLDDIARQRLADDPELGLLALKVMRTDMAVGFNTDTGQALRASFNAFLEQMRRDGTLQDMTARWFYLSRFDKVAVPNANPKGELRIAVSSSKGMPSVGLTGPEPIGFDIELCERFAAYLGRAPKFIDLDIPGLTASVATGKVDMAGSVIAITEERKRRIAFSDPVYPSDWTIMALKSRLPPKPRLLAIDDLAGKAVGLTTGTIFDLWAQQRLPGAMLKRFNATPDMILALHAGKLDAAIVETENGKAILRTDPDLGLLDDDLLSSPVGAIFRKEDLTLRRRFDAWLAQARADGTYARIRQRWLVDDPEKAVMPARPPAPAGARTLRVAVSVGDMPWVAEKSGRLIGHDVEMIEAFAAAEGFRLAFSTMDFGALVTAVQTGKQDIGLDAISINAERARQIAFSEPYAVVGAYMLARKKDLEPPRAADASGSAAAPPPSQSWWDRIHANLVQEDRWKLIADGLGVTAIVSVMSTVFGTILGAAVCALRMSRNGLLRRSAGFYIWLLRGVPVLVLVMIIYYVVFASVDVNPVLVASIAFGLNMAAYSAEMMRTSIESIDRGQTEAGIAGGFTRSQAFRLIILPQAMRQGLPVFKGEVISLVKMTSVVGYVAVQDITKASDIIRSRTFDAFVPLIVTAIIYLALAWLVTYLLDKVEWRVTPKHRRPGAAK